ncbi:MAG: peptide-methionine (S)-S-oxide reductase MsrA [Vallitaleaceae bacterium]|jgi:peptide-methionine (S)-S-oxide reductase|nr:peptide-methionine (S)-S-oxide reductase MsrA [Vallitaleaceae bacterium]
MKNITFAGGCFWGIEEYFSRIDGVLSTTVGYVNGHKKEPTYEEVCSGRTGHAEAVSLDFNPDIVSLKDLLKAYWAIIDPTVLNRQGPDRGTQYRTGIYYKDPLDLPVIKESLNQEQLDYVDPIVTEVLPLDYYYDAEGYHQDYLKKNPGGYCHIKLD